MIAKVIALAVAMACALAAGGCATITTGTTQPINVDSDPQGAECRLTRDGQTLATVTSPAPATIKRASSSLHVTCRKDGYADGRVVMNSRFETASAGNFLLGGVIGVMVDASSGASSRYDGYVMVRLTALSPAEQAAAAVRLSAPPPAPAQPVAAMVPPSPTPFDGDYHGGLQLGQASNTLRRIEIRIEGGAGAGAVHQDLCPTPGEIRLRVDSSGAVTGEMNVLMTGTCAMWKRQVEGRAEGDQLKLILQGGHRPIDFSLSRGARTARAKP